MPDELPPLTFIISETTLTTGFGEWTYGFTGDTAKRTWTIQCSRQPNTITEIDLAYASLGVAIGDAYKTDDSRYCQKVTVRAVAGDLTGLYGEAEYGPNQLVQNPLMRKDTISLEVGGETESWFKDRDDKITVTSAGELFDKIPPRTTGGVKLVIEGNRATLPAEAMIDLSRPSHVNAGSITVRGLTLSAGQAKLVNCTGSEQTENDVTFYRVKWTLELAPNWDMKFDDRGFYEKTTNSDGDPVLKPILTGEPPEQTKKPWPLNGSGTAYTDPSSVPASITLKPYPTGTFSFSWTSAA